MAHRSPHWFSTKLSPILVIPLNFRQFLWLFIESFSDSLKFSPKLVTKNTQNRKELLSPELVIFLSLKNSPILSNHQNFHQNWWQKKQNRKELLSSELVTFLSLKNSPISSNHQNVHQNWWKFNRKFKSPKHSPKLVNILAKIHWKMNVVSYLWDHIDFLQNCHQFWWFSSIFANFCDFL